MSRLSVTYNSATGNVDFRWYRFDPDTSSMVTEFEASVPPVEAVHMAADIHRETAIAAAEAVKAALVGECGTCGNQRVVQITKKHGGTERVRCPECGPRWENPPPIPVVSRGTDT